MSFSEFRRGTICCVIYTAFCRKRFPPRELAARGEADNFLLCLRESKQEETELRLKAILREITHFEDLPDRHYPLEFRMGAYLVEDPSVDITIIQDRARIACQQQRQAGNVPFLPVN